MATFAETHQPLIMQSFLSQKGDYHKLKAYQKAECIYDLTYYFTRRFLSVSDRTTDQMLQAARSGKQNIAEGEMASVTSRETEIKLINVARASLGELAEDYKDYLRVRKNASPIAFDSEQGVKLRDFCKNNLKSEVYRDLSVGWSDEQICNVALTLISQTDYLLNRLNRRNQEDFVKKGGIREQMTAARLEYRGKKR